MPKKRIPRNAPCPCGSGKKFKNCCYEKGFHWVQDEDRTNGKSIPRKSSWSNFGKPSSTSMAGT